MAKNAFVLALIVLSFSYRALSFDPKSLQDFCVAKPSSPVRVNDLTCRDPSQAGVNDFYFSGLHIPGNITNPVGSKNTPVFMAQIPGLNTLGISMARVDYAQGAVNPPHIHPGATEIHTVLEGVRVMP